MTLNMKDNRTRNFLSKFISTVPLKLTLVGFTVAFSASFQYGYSSTYVNTAQLSFMDYVNASIINNHQWAVDRYEFSWIWSFVVNSSQIGFVIGALLVPFLAEKFGRRWTLLTSIAPESLGICLAATAIPLQIPALLCIGRIIMSIASGINLTASTLYLQEISPTPIRGFISSFQEFTLCISSLTGLIMGLPSILGCESCLIYLICLGFVGTAPRLILLFCPETPKYILLKKTDRTQAYRSIKFYHGPDANIEDVLKNLVEEGNLDEEQHFTGQYGQQKVSKLKRMWNEKHIRKAVILGIVVFMAIECSGIIPIYEFSTYIMEDTGLTANLAELGTLLMSICNTIFTVVSMLIVERFGRRRLLLIGFTGLLMCLIGFMGFDICYQQLGVSWAGYGSMVCLILHSIIYSMGPGPICWYITSELVPQHLRSAAQGFTQICNQLAALFISFVFFPAFISIGPYSFLIICIIPLVVCVIYIYFELPETKNREISAIVRELKSKHEKKIKHIGENIIKF